MHTGACSIYNKDLLENTFSPPALKYLRNIQSAVIFPTTRLIKRSFRQRRDLYRCHFPSKIQAKLKMNSFPETLIQILSLGRIARKQNDHSKIPPEPLSTHL